MRIKIMSREAIDYIKQNIETLVHYYEEGAEPEVWLKDNGIKNPFIVTEVDFIDEPFSLSVGEEKASDTECQNVIEMYSHMINLSDSYASDERLWAGLAHTMFYDFMQQRWKHQKLDAKNILNHYFFSASKPRCYLINTLSSFWWIGRKMYLEGADDPFRLVKAISNDINGYAFRMFGSSWADELMSVKCLVEEVKRYKSEYESIYGTKMENERLLVSDLSTYLNALSVVVVPSLCSEDYLKQRIRQEIYRLRGELPCGQLSLELET